MGGTGTAGNGASTEECGAAQKGQRRGKIFGRVLSAAFFRPVSQQASGSTEEEVGGAPGAVFRWAFGDAEEGLIGAAAFAGFAFAIGAGGVERLRDEGEGGIVDSVETQTEACIVEGELLVFALELKDAVLGFDDEVADGAIVARGEGSLDFHEFAHQAVSIHGARSSAGVH